MKMKIVEENRDIDTILEEGLDCEAEVYVYEVVGIIMQMVKNIKKTKSYQQLLEFCGPECETAIQDFVISLICSQIATITGNFKDRDIPSGKA